jgi:hypothetical protein
MGFPGFFFCPRGNLRDEGCPTFDARISTFVDYFTSGADEFLKGFLYGLFLRLLYWEALYHSFSLFVIYL